MSSDIVVIACCSSSRTFRRNVTCLYRSLRLHKLIYYIIRFICFHVFFFTLSNARPVPHSLLAVSGIYIMISERNKNTSSVYPTHPLFLLLYIHIVQKRENAYNILYPSLLIRARGASVRIRRIATRVRNTSSYRLTGFHCRL